MRCFVTGSQKPRKGLADFLGQALKTTEHEPRAKPKGNAKLRKPRAQGVETKSHRVTDGGTDRVTKSVSDEVPLYRRLTRKEVRFRDEQLEALDRIVRRLSRARRGTQGERRERGERVTENTLVRVAVDLLLKVEESLQGETEAELLRSVTRKKQTHGDTE